MQFRCCLLVAGISLLTMTALPALAQSLTPRTPGLWQVDSTVTMAPMGGTQKRSDKLCITPELATRDVAPPNALQDDGWKCASSLVGSSRDKAIYSVICKQGADVAKGSGDLSIVSSKEFKGNTRIEASMEGMKVSVQADYAGRFVSAACGNAPLMKWEGFTEASRKK